MNKMTVAQVDAYKLAKVADDAFHAAVVKQFGKKNAGTMRYIGSKHNAETKTAAERYWIAANAMVDANIAARVVA